MRALVGASGLTIAKAKIAGLFFPPSNTLQTEHFRQRCQGYLWAIIHDASPKNDRTSGGVSKAERLQHNSPHVS
jgi:hypothetical protein